MELTEGENSRHCTKCYELKHFDEFYSSKLGKYGVKSSCKTCSRKSARKRYRKNEEKRKQYAKRYYSNNKKKIADKSKIKYILNNSIERNYEKFRDNLNQSKFCSECNEYKSFDGFWKGETSFNLKSSCIECIKEYRKNNKKWRKHYQQKYLKENKERLNKKRNKYRQKRFETDKDFKLRYNISSRIRLALKNNKKLTKTEELLGCSIQEVREHLEDQFEEGMTWNNHGEWHIDHIIPCSSFDLSDPKQQEECFHYSNLQPLWAEDNLTKSDKLIQNNICRDQD